MNNIIIHGRLGRDPELKTFNGKNGETFVCGFVVAVDRRYGEETDWFECEIFGKRAEVINKFFKKGSEIVVSGEMQCRPYEAKDGTKRYPWKLLVSDFDFCGGGKKNNEDVPDGFIGAVDDEDIPF